MLDGHYKGSVQAFFIKGVLYVVTTDRAGTARLWETLTGRRLKVLDLADLDGHKIWTACQPQNNNKIITLDKNGFVVTVDVSSVSDIRSTDLTKEEINKHLALVTPNIFIASENGDQKIVESLLASGTDLNVALWYFPGSIFTKGINLLSVFLSRLNLKNLHSKSHYLSRY